MVGQFINLLQGQSGLKRQDRANELVLAQSLALRQSTQRQQRMRLAHKKTKALRRQRAHFEVSRRRQAVRQGHHKIEFMAFELAQQPLPAANVHLDFEPRTLAGLVDQNPRQKICGWENPNPEVDLPSLHAAQQLLARHPHWILVSDNNQLLQPADLHTYLQTLTSHQPTDERKETINLQEIPARRYDLARIAADANLFEALELMNRQQLDALWVESLSDSHQPLGIISRAKIDDYYRI